MAKVRVQGLMGLCTSLCPGHVLCVLARATVAQHDKFPPSSTRNANSRQVSNRLSFTACIWCSKWLWRHLRSKSSPIATSLFSSGMDFFHMESSNMCSEVSQYSIPYFGVLHCRARQDTRQYDTTKADCDTMNPRYMRTTSHKTPKQVCSCWEMLGGCTCKTVLCMSRILQTRRQFIGLLKGPPGMKLSCSRIRTHSIWLRVAGSRLERWVSFGRAAHDWFATNTGAMQKICKAGTVLKPCEEIYFQVQVPLILC